MPPSDADVAHVERIAGPLVGARGLDLESVVRNRNAVVVTVDRDGGVALDEIGELTAELNRALDDADVGSSAYTLEVGSPGAERVLSEPRHFRRARGRAALVQLRDGSELTARIGPLTDEGVLTLIFAPQRGTTRAPKTREVAVADISRAKVQVEFSVPGVAELQLAGLTATEIATRRTKTPTDVETTGTDVTGER